MFERLVDMWRRHVRKTSSCTHALVWLRDATFIVAGDHVGVIKPIHICVWWFLARPAVTKCNLCVCIVHHVMLRAFSTFVVAFSAPTAKRPISNETLRVVVCPATKSG